MDQLQSQMTIRQFQDFRVDKKQLKSMPPLMSQLFHLDDPQKFKIVTSTRNQFTLLDSEINSVIPLNNCDDSSKAYIFLDSEEMKVNKKIENQNEKPSFSLIEFDSTLTNKSQPEFSDYNKKQSRSSTPEDKGNQNNQQNFVTSQKQQNEEKKLSSNQYYAQYENNNEQPTKQDPQKQEEEKKLPQQNQHPKYENIINEQFTKQDAQKKQEQENNLPQQNQYYPKQEQFAEQDRQKFEDQEKKLSQQNQNSKDENINEQFTKQDPQKKQDQENNLPQQNQNYPQYENNNEQLTEQEKVLRTLKEFDEGYDGRDGYDEDTEENAMEYLDDLMNVKFFQFKKYFFSLEFLERKLEEYNQILNKLIKQNLHNRIRFLIDFINHIIIKVVKLL